MKNKISDLKVGDEVVTKLFGKGIVFSKIRTWLLGMYHVAVKVHKLEVKNNSCCYFYHEDID